MKKLTITSLLALTFAFGMGLSLPTYATTNQTIPTYNDINRAVSQLKGSGQYYEYAALIQDINSGRTYRLATDILAVDSTLDLNNKTNAELVNIAKALPNYDLYVYLSNLVDYTENWMPNYYSASATARLEAYDAVNDAIITCKHFLKAPTAKVGATRSTTPTETQQSQSIITSNAPQTAATTEATTPTNTTDTTTSNVTEVETRQVVAKSTTPIEAKSTIGTTISVTVLPQESEDEDENQVASVNSDDAPEDTATNPIAANLTYAATATSLAGAVLATKREFKHKTHRF